MQEDLLKEFRKEYDKGLKQQLISDDDLKVLIKRRSLLENSTIVKDYIQLNSQIETILNNSYNKDEVFNNTLSSFEDKGLMSDTNEIYVYNGTYYTRDGITIRVHKDNPCGEFDKYINLESLYEIEISIHDRSVFEESHKIVPLDGLEPTKGFIYDLRSQFIEYALCDGQEVACKKVLSRKKKNL